MSRYLKYLFLLLLLIPSVAHATAVGEICGDGVDNDGTGGDALCAGNDQDGDGYFTSGNGPLTGNDCDDTNRDIYPGAVTISGCSAGQYRTCQANGTYTACADISTYTCNTGAGSGTIWFDYNSGNNSNAGTYASPKKDYTAFSYSAATGYRTPVAGDCYVLKDNGVYTASHNNGGTIYMMRLFQINGTASNRITITSAPGQRAKIQGIGTNPSEVIITRLEQSNYITIKNLEIYNGYSGTGIYVSDASSNILLDNLKIHDIDGIGGNNNLSGIKIAQGSNNVEVAHSILWDNYDRADPLNPNNANLSVFDVSYVYIHHNTSYYTTAAGGPYAFKIKHGYPGGSAEVSYNVGYNLENACLIWNQPQTWIHHNYCEYSNQRNSGAAFVNADGGGYSEFDRSIVEKNTVVNSNFLEWVPITTYANIGSPALTVRDNVVIDNRSSTYPIDGVDGFIRINHYGSDALYTDTNGYSNGSKFSITNNCYFNSASPATPLYFDVFGDSGTNNGTKGATYTGLTAWQAAGYDSGTFLENPALDSSKRATSTNCANKGARQIAVSGTAEPICPNGSTPRSDVIWCSDFESYNNPSCITGQEGACATANGLTSLNPYTGPKGFAIKSCPGGAAVGNGCVEGAGGKGGTGPGYSSVSFTPTSTSSVRGYVRFKDGYMQAQSNGGNHAPGYIFSGTNGCNGIISWDWYAGTPRAIVEVNTPAQCGNDGSFNLSPNQGSNWVPQNNRWYLFELKVQMNTTASSTAWNSGNGIVTLKIDGNKVVEYTNINMRGASDASLGAFYAARSYYGNGIPGWQPNIAYDNFALSNNGTDIGAASNENSRGTADINSPYINYVSYWGMQQHKMDQDCAVTGGDDQYNQTGLTLNYRSNAPTYQTSVARNFYTNACDAAAGKAILVTTNSAGAGGGYYLPLPGRSVIHRLVNHGFVYLPSTNSYASTVPLSGFIRYGSYPGGATNYGNQIGVANVGGVWGLALRINATTTTMNSAISVTTNAWHEYEIHVTDQNKCSLMVDRVWVINEADCAQNVSGWLWDTVSAGETSAVVGIIDGTPASAFNIYFDDADVGSASYWDCKGWDSASCPFMSTGASPISGIARVRKVQRRITQ